MPSSLPSARPAIDRHGFTLIEMLVVIAIIAGLMATFVATGFTYYQKRARHGQAKLQIAAIGSAIDSYPQRYWTINPYGTDPSTPSRNLPMWDLDIDSNDDEILDGSDLAGTYPGYTGFVRLTGFRHEPKDLDATTGALLDPWGSPYRIRMYRSSDTARFGSPAKNPFTPRWFGVFSCGPDGIKETNDDVRGWEVTGE